MLFLQDSLEKAHWDLRETVKQLLQDTLPWRVKRSLWITWHSVKRVSDYGETWLNEDLIMTHFNVGSAPSSSLILNVFCFIPTAQFNHLSLIFLKVNIFLFRISLCLFFKFLLPLSLTALIYSIQYSVTDCCLLQSSAAPYRFIFFCLLLPHWGTLSNWATLILLVFTSVEVPENSSPLKPLFPFLMMHSD